MHHRPSPNVPRGQRPRQDGRWPAKCAAAAAAVVALAAAAPASAVPTLSLVPSTSAVAPGQAFTLNVRANDFTDLAAYQFNLGFSASLFRVTGVAAGPFLSAAGTAFFSPGTINNTAGTVSFVLESLVGPIAGASGSGLLAIVSLSALAGVSGTGTIGLADVIALDSASNGIALGPLTSIGVSVVPEPSAAWLLALGIAGLACRRWRVASRSPA